MRLHSLTCLWQLQEEVYLPVAGRGYTPEQWIALRVGKISHAGVASLLAQLEYDEVAQVVTATYQDLALARLLLQDGVTVCLCLPLRRRGELCGIHIAGYRGRRQLFTPQQECLARGMMHLASLVLENAQLSEELNCASQCKEEFLGVMSHELRTSLSMIMGYNQLLLEGEFGPLTAEQASILQKVEHHSQKFLDRIDALLELNRLEAGQLPVEPKGVSLSDLIEELAAETWVPPEKRGLSLVWQVAPDLPRLWTDPRKLKVVVKELLHNAVKFTDQGQVTVGVYPRNKGVEIWVADTGSGIGPETATGIFELFRQADGSMARRYEGMGIGLYRVKRLLELLGSTIKVESAVGYGSTFRFWIPTERR